MPSAELIDTHCHLTSLDEKEVEQVVTRASEQGVTRLICIGASEGKKSTPAAVRLAEKYPNIWATAGIHPHDAGEFSAVTAIESFAEHPKVVAIGETGLDFFRDWSPVDKQFELFRSHIDLAKKVKKPIIIHCRDAQDDTMKVLREENAAEVGGVFHCYAGDDKLAQELKELNFLVSFPGTVTFKKAEELRAVVAKIPLEQMMVETDSPYMAPEPFRGKPSEPMHVSIIAQKIAEVKGISLEEVAQQTSKNAEKLFGIV